MAVPKRRVSKTRRDKRRASNSRLECPALEKCSHCGELKRSHRLCTNCGFYNGREVVKKEA